VKFPKIVRFRQAECKIYGKSESYPFYRVSGSVAGKRRMSSHATYAAAKAGADKLVREIAGGNQSAALNPQQASDALAALERLQSLSQITGRRVSLLAAVSEFAEASAKLDGRALSEAVDGFLNTVATVKRVDIAQAMEQFIDQRKSKTIAARDGKRPRLSGEWFGLSSGWLREFAATFPGYAVCDLSKDCLSLYMQGHVKAAPKTRNARRGAVKMFLRWAVERDYLPAHHRLFEIEDLKHEADDPEDIHCYRPSELAALLANADAELAPAVALAALAGIRLKEILRLTWEDVFRIPGHIEISAVKSKTRSRRLVQLCPSLVGWLEPCRDREGAVWGRSYDQFHWHLNRLLRRLTIPNRRNGFRHAYISAHYSLHADEGLTAQQAGNSPDVIHRHYKGLCTKADAEKWFAIAPAAPPNVVRMKQQEVIA
jgi:integrase